MGKIQTFKDLVAWQEAADFAVAIYSATKTFPGVEQFGLTSQLRRAAISISSNIAEGFKRNSRREKQQFYAIAHGSLAEIESQLEVAHRVQFLNDASYQGLVSNLRRLDKLIQGLVSSARDRV